MKFIRWLYMMIKAITEKVHEEKRGRNLLLSEMKTVKIVSNPNSPKRGRNILINAYAIKVFTKKDDK